MGFSRQEYWSGLLFPSPGDLPDPGIEPLSTCISCIADGFFTAEPLEPAGKPQSNMAWYLVAQRLKRLPAMWETWVQSLGQEDPLEKEMATHSSILAWRIPRTEEPGGLQSMGSQRVRHD